jgi:hypothetical protein
VQEVLSPSGEISGYEENMLLERSRDQLLNFIPFGQVLMKSRFSFGLILWMEQDPTRLLSLDIKATINTRLSDRPGFTILSTSKLWIFENIANLFLVVLEY